MFRALSLLLVLLAVHCFSAGEAAAQTSEFTFQGTLNDGASPANGNYEFEFKLFNLISGGVQQGGTLLKLNVPVTQGIFKVSLDFGAGVLPGADRFLDIAVRPTGGGAFTPLIPRQKVSSAPYSVRSLNSANADVAANATQLGGVAANQYVITTDPRMTDARNPLANSPNYIQNTAVQQAASNFNISGNGTAGGTLSGGIVNAATQYNLGGNRFLIAGSSGTAVGINAGLSVQGTSLGRDAGASIGLAFGNTFLGFETGKSTVSGTDNTFVGAVAGKSNTTGGSNTLIGASAGEFMTGSENVAIGSIAGGTLSDSSANTFLGARTGASSGLTNATAVGYRAFVTQSNSLILGSVAGATTVDTNVGIGTTSPARRLHVSGGTSGATSLASSDLVIEDDGAAFQHFLTPDDIESGILFGDPNASIGGGIIFNNAVANNGIQFRSGGNTTRVTLDGSGNLGIGTVAPNNRLEVIGTIGVTTLGAAGPTHLCRNASNQISTCSSPRPGPAEDTLAGSVEELRTEITALKNANLAQQKQIDEQRDHIQTLLRLACSQTSEPTVCRP